MILSATQASRTASTERGSHSLSVVKNNVYKHYCHGSCRAVRMMKIVEGAARPDGTLAVPVDTGLRVSAALAPAGRRLLPTAQLTPTTRATDR
jgi:hypothetical protein